MVKIDFLQRTVQLWPDEYEGQIIIKNSSVSFKNSRGTPNSVTLPSDWFEGPVSTSHRPIPNSPPIQTAASSGGDAAQEAPIEQKLNLPDWSHVEKLKTEIKQLETIQKIQIKDLTETMREKFNSLKKVASESDGIQKLEKRVVFIEHYFGLQPDEHLQYGRNQYETNQQKVKSNQKQNTMNNQNQNQKYSLNLGLLK